MSRAGKTRHARSHGVVDVVPCNQMQRTGINLPTPQEQAFRLLYHAILTKDGLTARENSPW